MCAVVLCKQVTTLAVQACDLRPVVFTGTIAGKLLYTLPFSGLDSIF